MMCHLYIERYECVLKSSGQYIFGCNSGRHIEIKSIIKKDHSKLTS